MLENQKMTNSTPNPTDIHVGMRVRTARLSHGLSQARLADALGISQHQLRMYESGRQRIDAAKLLEMCALFGVRPSFFFERPEFARPATEGRAKGADRPENVISFATVRKETARKHGRPGVVADAPFDLLFNDAGSGI